MIKSLKKSNVERQTKKHWKSIKRFLFRFLILRNCAPLIATEYRLKTQNARLDSIFYFLCNSQSNKLLQFTQLRWNVLFSYFFSTSCSAVKLRQNVDWKDIRLHVQTMETDKLIDIPMTQKEQKYRSVGIEIMGWMVINFLAFHFRK